MIVILTYGKVGSLSLRAALTNRFGGEVFYTHGLQAGTTGVIERLVQSAPAINTSGMAAAFSDNSEIRRRMNAGEPITLVVGVREPVARSLSALMQIAPTVYADQIDEDIPASAGRLAAILAELWTGKGEANSPVEQMARLAVRAPLTWLRDEIEAPFGFDLTAEPFDFERNYRILVRDNIRLMLYRMEGRTTAVEAGLRDLFPGEDFSLPRRNITADKETHGIYDVLKQTFRLPGREMERIYASRYVAHFLTTPEMNNAMTRWSLPKAQPREGARWAMGMAKLRGLMQFRSQR
jgi:hypothetical protein